MSRVQTQRKQGTLGRWAILNRENHDLQSQGVTRDQVSQMIDNLLPKST